MTSTYNDSTNEMRKRFRDSVVAVSTPIVGAPLFALYAGLEANGKLPRDKICARVDIQHIFEDQQTLSTCVGKPFQKRYLTSGMLFIEFYGPKTIENSQETIGKLAEIAKAAFRGKPMEGNIVFRRTRIVSGPKEDEFYRLDVISEFEYNQIG